MGETEESVPTANEQQKSNQETEDAKETDKMLNKEEKLENENNEEKTDEEKKPVNGEEIIKAPETTTATSKVNAEEREVKPKKIPIGGIKMPGFFTKNKPPRPESDGAEGELLENAVNEEQAKPVKNESFFSSFRLRNPFKRQDKLEDEEKGLTKEDVDQPNEKKSGETEQKKKPILNAIRLPLANMIPKRLKKNSDIEMGNGPNTRAGLASMETLDDSQKDQGSDTTDRAVVNDVKGDDGMENVKLDNPEDKEKENKDDVPKEKPPTCWERIRNYRCSVDDLAILGGVILFILIFAIILAFALSGSSELKEAPLRGGKYVKAITSCGEVEGLLEDGAYAFRGIPYAMSPINENRWRPAVLIDNIDNCWNDTFKAHNATPPCLQVLSNGTTIGIEDCLQLDVITPHIRYENPLPVIVLIGSETMSSGSPTKLRPSARYARSRDVIFVRPNFRIGIYGFLALDALTKTSHPPTSGNYGLSDVIAALNWIQINIVHFGGNPKSVTLVGHRSGGTIVSALVTSAKLKDLYARAWVTSGAAIFPGKPLADSVQENKEFIINSGCKDAACLRQADSQQLLDATPDTWPTISMDLPMPDESTKLRHQWLVLDGDILQKNPMDAWNSAVGGPIKLVIGTTAHESHSEMLYEKHSEWTPELVYSHINESIIGTLGLTDEVLEIYPQTYQGLIKMISDIRTVCPLFVMAQAQPSVPFYVVTHPNHELNLTDVDADISAIIGRYEPITPEQRRYVSAMQQLFYHFVSHGEMKQYEVRRRVLDIGQDALPKDNYPNCNFWIKHSIVPHYGRVD